MIRLTLRQFRTQGLIALGALVILVVITAVTGTHLVHLYDTLVKGCKGANNCARVQTTFSSTDGQVQAWLNALVLVVPGLLGIFLGAPLVAREFETGTFRLAWTQSVTRTRWLAVKLGLVGIASMAAAGLTSLMVTWWSSPIDRVGATPFVHFDQRGIVPIAYAAFAFALGVTCGSLIRRTVPAMAATLVGFVGVRLAIYEWVRPRLMTPLKVSSPLLLSATGGLTVGGGLKPGDWIVTDQTINASGQVIGANGALGPHGTFGFMVTRNGGVRLSDGQACPNIHGSGASPHALTRAAQECLSELHLKNVVTYQPANRYWPFQGIESAIFIGIALLLAGFCFWWSMSRSSWIFGWASMIMVGERCDNQLASAS